MSTPTIHDAEHYGRHSIAPGRERIDVMFARLRAIANYREAMSASQAAAQFARALNRTHFDDITRELEAVK